MARAMLSAAAGRSASSSSRRIDVAPRVPSSSWRMSYSMRSASFPWALEQDGRNPDRRHLLDCRAEVVQDSAEPLRSVLLYASGRFKLGLDDDREPVGVMQDAIRLEGAPVEYPALRGRLRIAAVRVLFAQDSHETEVRLLLGHALRRPLPLRSKIDGPAALWASRHARGGSEGGRATSLTRNTARDGGTGTASARSVMPALAGTCRSSPLAPSFVGIAESRPGIETHSSSTAFGRSAGCGRMSGAAARSVTR